MGAHASHPAPLASCGHELRRRDHRMRPRRPAARARLRRPRPAHPRGRERCRAPGGGPRAPDAVRGAGRRRGACAARRRSPGRDARRRRRAGRRDRPHARHAVVLAHRDRHARHPLGRSTTCCRVLRPGHLLVLRSTIAPGTTEFVAGYIEKHLDLEVGEDVFVAHVPERIAAGRFFEEIGSLPCIVGGVGEASGEARRRAVRAARRADRADDARSRPSWRRSGPTSCATRCSRSPTG